MRISQSWSGYNARRYSKPWIAKVISWEVGKNPEISFGRFIGDDQDGGEVEIEAEVGDIIRTGQKDLRKRGDRPDWYVVEENGKLKDVTVSEARKLFKKESNPLENFTDEQIMEEFVRRGLHA